MNIKNPTFNLQDFLSRSVCVVFNGENEPFALLMQDLQKEGIHWMRHIRATAYTPKKGTCIAIHSILPNTIALSRFPEQFGLPVMPSSSYQANDPRFDDLDTLLKPA